MMYRLLKDLINWKCNFHIKCKLGKFRYATLGNSSTTALACVFFLVVILVDLVNCSNIVKDNNEESVKGRTLSEHGLFRHDNKYETMNPLPPLASDQSASLNNNGNKNQQKVGEQHHHSSSSSSSSFDPRDKYTTYDRFKRSVTSVNFHPKQTNSSASSSGLKPTMRLFKYVTENDVMHPSGPSYNSETHHETIFHSYIKNTTDRKSESMNHSTRVVGGAKVNLKAKFDKETKESDRGKDSKQALNKQSNQVIKNNDQNNKEVNKYHNDDEPHHQKGLKAASASKPIIPTPSKPENILIFKPTLAIRKTTINNKTSLIPSGKYSKLSTQHHLYQNQKQSQVSNGVSNSITAATSTKQQQPQEQDHHENDEEALVEEEKSTDPNSSTVNDRSLIHNFFDSVVVLNEEEGQKQLLQQQKGAYHREKTSNSDDVLDNGVGIRDDDDEEEEDEVNIKNNMSVLNPLEQANEFIETDNEDDKHKKRNEEEDNIAKEKNARKSTTGVMRNSTKVVVQTKMNGSARGNKDKIIVTVVKKSKREKKGQEGLAEDDVAQDGSERSRRSMPFAASNNRFPQSRNRLVRKRDPEQLAREALFRRNTAITMMTPQVMRQMNNPALKKIAVVPRFITHGVKSPIARTILPMKPIPVIPIGKKQMVPHKLALIPTGSGPIGPGPVGPPLAAIKVIPMGDHKNLFLSSSLAASSPVITNPSAPPLPITPTKDLMADASKTLFNYKPLPNSAILNQAAASFSSPSYHRFQDRLQNKLSDIMLSGKDIEDSVINQWEESRAPGRHSHPHHHRHHHHHHHPHHRPPPRSRSRSRDGISRHRNHRHPQSFDRRHQPPSSHRTGAHSQHPHHSLSGPRGKKLSGPKYTYPKNAENIQDILSYFDKEVPSPFGRGRSHHPMERSGPVNQKRQHSSLPASTDGLVGPAYPKLADLSGEFRDVHASLLKDIKEFAKRPHLFGSSSHRRDSTFRANSFESFMDPIDEIFNEKPLPVRDLAKPHHHGHDYIKPDLYSLENIRERIAFKRGKLGGRHRDKDHELNKDIHSHGFHDDPPHTDPMEDEYFENHRPSSRHNSHNEDSDRDRIKSSLFNSKEDYDNPSSYTKIGKYNKQDSRDRDRDHEDSMPLYPSSHYKDSHRESTPFDSSEYPSSKPSSSHSNNNENVSRKPIVLKRPKDTFRLKDEIKKLQGNDYYYNTFTKKFEKSPTTINLDSPLVLKTPQQTQSMLQPLSYNAFQAAASHAMTKPISVEEDIVEIHTGNPAINAATGIPTFTEAHLKQEKLKKMYMDILQQKMQLEAALLQPQVPLPATLHHPQIPGLASIHAPTYQPTHNPISLSHLSLGSQIAGFASPSTTVTLPPLTGLSGLAPRRKKPMRMKIHIYPNGNDGGIEQGLEAANLLAAGGLGFGGSGFSASNHQSSVIAPPISKDLNKMSESAISTGPTGLGPHPTSPSGYGASAPSAPLPGTVGSAVKNKNVVLHLHVHRRNDMLGPLELETEGSSPVGATAKPPPQLTYKQIYDEQMKAEQNDHQKHLQNHRMVVGEEEEETLLTMPSSTQEIHREPHSPNSLHHHKNSNNNGHLHQDEAERDKSISMEAPIHDEKIEDVFHSIMKLRSRPPSGVGNVDSDKRKKRNRN